MYETIQSETQHLHLTDIVSKAKSAERKLRLYALDNILWSLEELNLKDKATVPDDVVEQMRAFGIPYEPRIPVPDLIELVFTAQERYMNVEPEEINRVPTLEELEAYFEESRVA
jgi:hypothetical protein